ncbi:ESPR domain-containing protein [Azotobacter vinelandii]
MNRIFNIVWNRSLGGWTVASEHARQRGRPGGACRALASVVALAPPPALSPPTCPAAATSSPAPPASPPPARR